MDSTDPLQPGLQPYNASGPQGPCLTPNLLSLSANFSAESLEIDPLEAPTTPAAPHTPSMPTTQAMTPTPLAQTYSNATATPAGTRGLDATGLHPLSLLLADGLDFARLPMDTRRLLGSFESFSNYRLPSPKSLPLLSGLAPAKQFPFNFKPQEFGDSFSPGPVLKPAHRKGHRYRHSSVSTNLFQEPERAADASQHSGLITDLFLIPTVRELLGSTLRSQKLKLVLAMAHALTAACVLLAGVRIGQPAFSTLALLVFYDSLGSLIVACVDTMSNFQVWSQPSIALPFGLGRLEVLAGFALCTSLVMVGCDLVSHFLEEMVLQLVSAGDTAEHTAHGIHSVAAAAPNWLAYQLVLVLVLAVTWLLSVCIVEQTAITDLMEGGLRLAEKGPLDVKDTTSSRVKLLWKTIGKNPIRMLTVVYSLFLALVPVVPASLSGAFDLDINDASTFVVAAVLCYVGWRSALTLGGILLISFPYSDYDYNVLKAAIYDKVLALPSFKPSFAVHKIFLAKANPRLYVVGLEIILRGGSSEDQSRLTSDVNKIVSVTIKEFDDESMVETTVSVA